MANYTVTPKYPTAADVVAVALFLAQRQSDSGGTNGGIAANGNTPVPLIGQGGPYDVNAFGTAYLQAMVDAFMCSVGYQAQSDAAASSGSSGATTSFVDVPGMSSVSWTAPIGKTYVFHVDASCFCSALAGGADSVTLGINVDGTDYTVASARSVVIATNVHMKTNFRIPISVTAAAHTIKMRWRSGSAVTTVMNTDANDYRTITVTG